MVKLQKHHRDKYGRRIPDKINPSKMSRLEREVWINTIRKYLVENGMTTFEKDGIRYTLTDDSVVAEKIDNSQNN